MPENTSNEAAQMSPDIMMDQVATGRSGEDVGYKQLNIYCPTWHTNKYTIVMA